MVIPANPVLTYWNMDPSSVIAELRSSRDGLSGTAAQDRLATYGKNLLNGSHMPTKFRLLASQFKSPIVLIFIAVSILSYFLEDAHDAVIILAVVFLSAGLGFWQEHGATNAVNQLLSMVKAKVLVVRDGKEQEILSEFVVPGEIVLLGAGDKVPGDCLILESKDLFANESFLTGESFPVRKGATRVLDADMPMNKRSNSLFMGSHVMTGNCRAIVVHTGKNTEFAKISSIVQSRRKETNFEQGVRKFGYFLAEITLILVIANFGINVYLQRSTIDSFLFSLALAIGMTPQLLPAVISVNLAHGAKRMASKRVIVKRLDSIENLGSMNILCSDKTGTLTTGRIDVHSYLDISGQKNSKVLFYAYLNSLNESGFVNPIDKAIIEVGRSLGIDVSGHDKVDEIPFDFTRRRLSVLVRPRPLVNRSGKGSPYQETIDRDLLILITKGAAKEVLASCTNVEAGGSISDLDEGYLEKANDLFENMSHQGFRVIGVSYQFLPTSTQSVSKEDENGSTFLGFLILWDPIKDDASKSIAILRKMNISLKIITGDNHLIAKNVGERIGLSSSKLLTGPELDEITPESLKVKVNDIDIFAEIEPRQKERIILALRDSGNVVGYIGDGVNDAPALHASDISISVDTAADSVKEEADMVLLEKDLKVLGEGVKEGRKTFANTLKYVFMATSSNFGNMFSTAVASFFLPFVPMLPKQILLNNLLTDVQEMTIASDNVEGQVLARPRKWQMATIRRFMLIFGTASAVFDFLMFGILIFGTGATTEQFRTAWFVESVLSASIVVLIIRSGRPLFRSRPSRLLFLAVCIVSITAAIVPFTIIGQLFGLVQLSFQYYLWIILVVASYALFVEFLKRIFFRSRYIKQRD